MLADVVRSPGALDFVELVRRHDGRTPDVPPPGDDDVALLTYTSGTTGPPKGAMNTHGNVVFSSQTYRDWVGVGAHDVILGAAPLFHITGLIAHVGLSLLSGAPLVLDHRFDAARALELIAFCRRHMAAYKYPRQIEFVDQLPRTASGKVLRRVLRDR